MTEPEDMQDRRDQIEREIRRRYEEGRAKVRTSDSWTSWKSKTSRQRTKWIVGVGIVALAVIGLVLA